MIPPELDETHDPAAQSWVGGVNGHSDFPLQNLPLGRFDPGTGQVHAGVALGDWIVDLRTLAAAGLLPPVARSAAELAQRDLLALSAPQRQDLRQALFRIFRRDGDGDHANTSLRDAARAALIPQRACRVLLPAAPRGFTDFQAGIHHTLNGRKLRGGAASLPFNYHQVPIGYHGRSSSVVPSGVSVRRPCGQLQLDGALHFGPTRKLDIELELGIWISSPNGLGDPVPIGQAGNHIAGYCLVNDWSARDLMAWEMDRLGPFQGKSFATTVSPWVISPEALAPFRAPAYARGDSPVLQAPSHLLDPADERWGGLTVQLEVNVGTAQDRADARPMTRVATSHTRYLYWTPAQLVAHHTVNGCNLETGDLLGTGTISGPSHDESGSFKELGGDGGLPFMVGSRPRCWAEDGDEVMLRGHAVADGARSIGFGECRAIVEAART